MELDHKILGSERFSEKKLYYNNHVSLGTQGAYLHCVQVPCFGSFQKPVVHVGIPSGNVFWEQIKERSLNKRASHFLLKY